MITADVIAFLLLAFVPLSIALLLVYGIYTAITDKNVVLCVGMVLSFLVMSVLSGGMFRGAYEEYQNAIPQNQVKILKQKISDAEKDLQKYLIDHPELKEEY